MLYIIKCKVSLGMVVQIYNPSYFTDRGRSIWSSSPAWAKLAKPYRKNRIKTKGLGRRGVWLRGYRNALASMKPWIKSSVWQKLIT
jgi:hypothetical protein